MTDVQKAEIGARLRQKRERAGYTREEFGELCGLSPRFIANIELGDSAFSLDSLMTVCKVLSCSSDALLFGESEASDLWSETVSKLKCIDPCYRTQIDAVLRGLIELINIAWQKRSVK